MLYERLLAEVRPFLAGQSESFINRQCRLHLNIPVELLSREHLPDLAWWVRVSASLVISKDRAEILAAKILELDE
jgi:hypothetical protein